MWHISCTAFNSQCVFHLPNGKFHYKLYFSFVVFIEEIKTLYKTYFPSIDSLVIDKYIVKHTRKNLKVNKHSKSEEKKIHKHKKPKRLKKYKPKN